MNDEKNKERYKQMLVHACGGSPVIEGHAMGPKPKVFIIGDWPHNKDFITGIPFSGIMNDVLVRTIDTLHGKLGTEQEDCYTTYLVKSQPKGTLDSKWVETAWLDVARMEYAISGCDIIVAIGKVSKQYANRIRIRPAEYGCKSPILERVGRAWQTLISG